MMSHHKIRQKIFRNPQQSPTKLVETKDYHTAFVNILRLDLQADEEYFLSTPIQCFFFMRFADQCVFLGNCPPTPPQT